MPLRLDLDVAPGLTFGQLYLFADQARAADVGPGTAVTLHTQDQLGNDLGVHKLSAELDVTELMLPVLIPGHEAPRFAELLGKLLRQETDRDEEKELWDLQSYLYGGSRPKQPPSE